MSPLSILIVDFSAIFRTFWHAKAGQETSAAFEFTLGKIRKTAADFDRCAIAVDSPKSRRKALSAEYKAARQPVEAACIDQMRRTLDVLRADGYPIFECEGEEGDDIIASFCAHFAMVGEITITILGCDKDLTQCLRPGVSLLNSNRGDTLASDDVLPKFGVRVDQWIDYQAIVGDPTDGVKGAFGVGAKRAAVLLAKFGTLANIMSAAQSDTGEAQLGVAVCKGFRDASPWLDQSRALVTLRTDIDLPFEAALEPRTPKAAPVRGDAWEGDDEDEGTLCAAPGCKVTMLDDNSYDVDGAIYCKPHALEIKAAAAKAAAVAIPSDVGPASLSLDSKQGHDAVKICEDAFRDMAKEVSDILTPPIKDLGPIEIPKPKPPERAPASTAIVLDRTDPRWALAIEPRDSRGAIGLAERMFDSGLFPAFGNPNAILAVILMGRTRGLDAMTALAGMHVIEGKPAMSAQLMVGLVLSSKQAEYFDLVETTWRSATYETKRVGSRRAVPMTYTVEDAQRAGLVKIQPDGSLIARSKFGKALNWEKDPGAMCMARASARLCRAVYQDICANTYTPDEIRDGDAAEVVATTDYTKNLAGVLDGH